MISTLERDQVGPSSRLPRQLHSGLDGLGTRVPEEEGIERRVGHSWDQPINELEVWGVECD